MIKTYVVYFNQWFSSIGTVIENMKSLAENDGHKIKFIGSSTNSNHAYKNIVDKFYTEEWKNSEKSVEFEKEYIEWILNLCKEENVDVFFAKKHSDLINKHQDEFEKLGVKVVSCGDMPELKTKKSTYENMVNDNLIECYIPEYYDGKISLFEWINEKLNSGSGVIMKLNEDEGGASYKEIVKSGPSYEQLKGYYGQKVSVSELENILVGHDGQEFIFMEYLNDPEISVDCCVTGNNNIIAIAREKNKTRVQRVFTSGIIIEIAENLRNHFKLKGMFNFQLRYDKEGNLKLLEVNQRISGGAYIETAVSINLIYITLIDKLDLVSEYVREVNSNWDKIKRDFTDGTKEYEFGKVTKIESMIKL